MFLWARKLARRAEIIFGAFGFKLVSSWLLASHAFDGETVRSVAGVRLQVIVFSQRAFGARSIETAKKALQLLYAVLSQFGFNLLLRLIPEWTTALHEIAPLCRQRYACLAM